LFIPNPPIVPPFQGFTSNPVVGNGGTGYTLGDTLALGDGNTAIVSGISAGGVITSTISGTVGTSVPVCAIHDVTQALLHFEGSNGATVTTDDYGNTVALTVGSKLTTAAFRFGVSSLDATDVAYLAKLTGPTSLGANGWTLECWVGWPGSIPNPSSIFHSVGASNYGVHLYYTSDSLEFDYHLTDGTDAYVTGSIATPTVGTWYHVALTRDTISGKYYLYWNGVKTLELASALAIVAIDTFWFGNDWSARKLGGYLDEFRFSNSCVYSGGTTFTPPIAPFTAVGLCVVPANGGTGTGAKMTVPTVATLNYATLSPSLKAAWLALSD
jgi:hypothetical protein